MSKLPDWKGYRKRKQEEDKKQIQPRWNRGQIAKRIEKLLNDAIVAHFTESGSAVAMCSEWWSKLVESLTDPEQTDPDQAAITEALVSEVWEELLNDTRFEDIRKVIESK